MSYLSDAEAAKALAAADKLVSRDAVAVELESLRRALTSEQQERFAGALKGLERRAYPPVVAEAKRLVITYGPNRLVITGEGAAAFGRGEGGWRLENAWDKSVVEVRFE